MAGEVQEDSKVKVCRYPGKGNGLQTELSLEAGTSIVDEKPVAYIVCKEKREIRCAYCLGPSPSLKAESGNLSIQSLLRKCSKCKFVYYCGTTCQKKDWSVHKQECKNIIKVQPKRPPDICLLASRLVTVLVKKESMRVHSSIPGSLPLTIEHILPMIKMSVTQNNHMISEKRREMLITFAVVLQQFLDEKQIESCGVPYSDLVGFLCWLTCNCFNILDDDMNSIGVGIYEKSCFINHSCTPNSVAIFERQRVSIRSIQPIKKGEEITISYIESIERAEDRQNELEERYFFKCKCEKCTNELERYDSLLGKCQKAECNATIVAYENESSCNSCGYYGTNENFFSKLSISYKRVRRELAKFNEGKTSLRLDALYDAVIEASELIPNDSVEMVKCNETLFDGFIENQNWTNALKCGSSLLEGYLSYYPRYHPITGIHLFKLGKLELAQDDLRQGLDFLEQCKDILLITHGSEHQLLCSLTDIIVKLKEEIIHIENK